MYYFHNGSSTFITYQYPKVMPIEYVHNGSFSEATRLLEIKVQMQFGFKDGRWTEFKNFDAFLDTGATKTFISNSIVPPEILDEYMANVTTGGAAVTTLNGIVIPLSHLRFPGLNTSGLGYFQIFLSTLIAFDDSAIKKLRNETNEKYFPLIIGMDALEVGELIFDGPAKRYTIQFNSK